MFEGQWKIGKWDWYERIQQNNKAIFRKIKTKQEYYIEDKNGQFKTLIDEKPLSKKVGRPPKSIKPYSKVSDADVNIRDNYWSETDTKYNMNPKIWYIDIETTALDSINLETVPEEVVLIQIYDNKLNKMIILGTRNWKGKYFKKEFKDEGIEVVYKNCKTERELFENFFSLIEKLQPLLVLGWHTLGFDYPYLYKRAKRLGFDTNGFSPFKETCKLEEQDLSNNTKSYKFSTPGIYYMDFMEIYKKYVFGEKASYSLDFISKFELGKGKIEHTQYNSFDGMRTGEGYIFPSEVPNDSYELEMYNLQMEYKNNPNNKLKIQIEDLAYDLFMYYGGIDTYRVKELDDKLQLSNILLMISSKMGITLQDSLGTVKPWSSFIEKVAYTKRRILPDISVDDDADTSVKGGYVADPQRGKHTWTISVDINSAYPNLSMRGFNMSPETYIPVSDLPEDLYDLNTRFFTDENEELRFKMYINHKEIFDKYTDLLHKYNYSAGITGAIFTKEKKGIIPELVEKIYSDRKEQKRQMLEWKQKAADKKAKHEDADYELYMASQFNTAQLVSKVLINSLYGALANKYFRLFNINIARAITGNTRFYILLMTYRIENYLQSVVKSDKPYTVYNDTDSGYFTLAPIVEKMLKAGKIENDVQKVTDWIDKFVKKKIDPIIESVNKEFATALNAFDPEAIKTEREVISDVSVFNNKKKYYMRVIDNEGVRYEEPDIKRIGIDIAKSTTPPFFKKKLLESIQIIFDSDIETLKEWVQEVKNEVQQINLDEIAKITGIGSLAYDLEKVEIKDGRKVAIPINSRAALATNKLIESNKDYKHRFQKITPGDKVKMLYLKEPNPFGQNIMAYIDGDLAEIYREYVDYELVFEKNFMAPLKLMIESIDDWETRLITKTEILDKW